MTRHTHVPDEADSGPQPKPRFVLEVCCESLSDVVAAEAGGADRIELCSALDLGGLTPSLGLLLAAQATTQLPIWVMIRPRGGDFVYAPDEVVVMARDIELCRAAHPAGYVFGALHPDGTIDRDACRKLLDLCGPTPAVFHRAFDRTPILTDALAAVAELGFRRVLTSGREDTAAAGASAIKRVRDRAEGRVEVLPCGQVRAENIEHLLSATGCDQVHGSFSEVVPLGEADGHRGYGARMRVSREQVAAARYELDRLAGFAPSRGRPHRAARP
jgi:copper homeostasis protein